MKDSYGTYDGRKPEPPHECPQCVELQADLDQLATDYTDLGALLFGEAEYEHGDVRGRVVSLLDELETLKNELERQGQQDTHISTLMRENRVLRETLEGERLRLAACGVAAMQNTPALVADRIGPEHPYYSASYGDVCRAVDREMALRRLLILLRRGECWCEVGIGNPALRGVHTDACSAVRALMGEEQPCPASKS
jgi:hypothetical protein